MKSLAVYKCLSSRLSLANLLKDDWRAQWLRQCVPTARRLAYEANLNADSYRNKIAIDSITLAPLSYHHGLVVELIHNQGHYAGFPPDGRLHTTKNF